MSTTRELEARFGALRMPAGAVPTGVTRVMLLSIVISLGVLLAVPVLQAPAAPVVLLVSLWLGGMAWALVRTIRLQRDLRQARVRALDARDLERRRIQRDLHDSAQQRLVSVRIQLGLLAERAASDDDRASIDQLGRGLEEALADIRSVTRDGAPPTLAGFGVEEALRSAAAQAALPVLIDSDGFGRYPPEIERAVYYSCVEALQNSVKHGGPNRGRPDRVARQPVGRLVRRRGLRGRVRGGTGSLGSWAPEPCRSGRGPRRPPHHRITCRLGHPHPRGDPASNTGSNDRVTLNAPAPACSDVVPSLGVGTDVGAPRGSAGSRVRRESSRIGELTRRSTLVARPPSLSTAHATESAEVSHGAASHPGRAGRRACGSAPVPARQPVDRARGDDQPDRDDRLLGVVHPAADHPVQPPGRAGRREHRGRRPCLHAVPVQQPARRAVLAPDPALRGLPVARGGLAQGPGPGVGRRRGRDRHPRLLAERGRDPGRGPAVDHLRVVSHLPPVPDRQRAGAVLSYAIAFGELFVGIGLLLGPLDRDSPHSSAR